MPLTDKSNLTIAFDRASKAYAKLPFSLVLVIITLFLPVELSFYIFGLRFTATRLLFIMLVPVLLIRLTWKISSRRYRFLPSDLFVVWAGIWLIFAPSLINSPIEALNHAGPDVLEFCIGYMTTRILLSKHGDAISFTSLLCQAIAVVALVGVLDPLMSYYVTHGVAGQLTGWPRTINDWDDAYRWGILRATGPIEHPIHFGFICTIGALIAASISIRRRLLVAILCTLGAILSFSSAPIQCLLIGFGLLIYNYLLIGVRFRWLALICIGALVGILAFFISGDPIGFVISHLIYSPGSGWYRVWTWDRVIYYVSQSPFYGLGFGTLPDEINHTIDSLWLVLAIRSGFPGVFFVALALMGSAFVPTSGSRVGLSSEEEKLGTTLGILIFLTIFIAFTVDLWGISWTLTGLLIGCRAHLGELGHLPPFSATRQSGVENLRPLTAVRRSKAVIRPSY